MRTPTSSEVGHRTLTVSCSAGLANRLTVLVSGLALARAGGRTFRMLWPRTPPCSASFAELFVNPWGVEESDAAADRALTDYGDGLDPAAPDLLEAGEAHVTARGCRWPIQPWRFSGHGPLQASCREILDALEPLPEIRQRIADFRREHFKPRMIGVHLRRGDVRLHQPDVAGNTAEAIAAVEDLLHRLPEAGILLCTDDGAVIFANGDATPVEGVRAKFRRRFGERVVWTTPRSLDRREPAAIQDAVMDLWLLRGTDAVVGTGGSSFSELAAYGRDVPLVLCQASTLRFRLLDRMSRLTGIPRLIRWQLHRPLRTDAAFAGLRKRYHRHFAEFLSQARSWLNPRAPTVDRLFGIWMQAPVLPASPAAPSGAVIYLVRSAENDVRDLVKSLTLLKANFLDRFAYPVILFVESDFREEWRARIARETGLACRFETVELTLPEFLDPQSVPPYVLEPKFGLGYRHMCRFFSGIVYRHPALRDYAWYWRLDTDSLILGPVRYDVFEFMERRGLVYGYNWLTTDAPPVVAGLWETTREYLAKRGIRPFFLEDHVRDGKWGRVMYYTNFEISRLDFWRSESYRDYFDHLDRSGGIYRHRWGDAVIHTLAVAIFLPRRKVHRFKNISYRHQGFVNHANPVMRFGRPARQDMLARAWRIAREAAWWWKYLCGARNWTDAASSGRAAGSAADVFTSLYDRKAWGNGSGAGSDPEKNRDYVLFLQRYLAANRIRSVVDLGCGDWRLARAMDWTGVAYVGVDVVAPLIEANRLAFGKPGIEFKCLDVLRGDRLPAADLLIVKDVLQHLDNGSAGRVLDLAPQFPRTLVVNDYHWRNVDCRMGDTRPLTLKRAPFRRPRCREIGRFGEKRAYEIRRDRHGSDEASP